MAAAAWAGTGACAGAVAGVGARLALIISPDSAGSVGVGSQRQVAPLVSSFSPAVVVAAIVAAQLTQLTLRSATCTAARRASTTLARTRSLHQRTCWHSWQNSEALCPRACAALAWPRAQAHLTALSHYPREQFPATAGWGGRHRNAAPSARLLASFLPACVFSAGPARHARASRVRAAALGGGNCTLQSPRCRHQSGLYDNPPDAVVPLCGGQTCARVQIMRRLATAPQSQQGLATHARLLLRTTSTSALADTNASEFLVPENALDSTSRLRAHATSAAGKAAVCFRVGQRRRGGLPRRARSPHAPARRPPPAAGYAVLYPAGRVVVRPRPVADCGARETAAHNARGR